MEETAEQRWFDPEIATFGDRLAGAREATGLTQPDLARTLGVRLKTLQQWEEDQSEPRANRLQMLAGMLNVSLTWLLTGEGDGLNAPVEGHSSQVHLRSVLTDLTRLKAQAVDLSGDIGRLEGRLRKILREDAA
jgi:transcriptional regulator with XRE-family HTH domain